MTDGAGMSEQRLAVSADQVVAAVREWILEPGEEIEHRRDWPDGVVLQTPQQSYTARAAGWLIAAEPWVAAAVRVVSEGLWELPSFTYGLVFTGDGEVLFLNDVRTMRRLASRVSVDVDPLAYAELLAELQSGRQIAGPVVLASAVPSWPAGSLVRDLATFAADYPLADPELVAAPVVRRDGGAVEAEFYSCHYYLAGEQGAVDLYRWRVHRDGEGQVTISREDVLARVADAEAKADEAEAARDAVWHPHDSVERHLAWALDTGEVDTFFYIIANADDLRVPLGAPSEAGWHGRELVWIRLRDRLALPVFTSDELLDTMVGDTAQTVVRTDFGHLRDTWPEPRWLLAINPGAPISALLPVGEVERLAAGAAPADPEIVVTDINTQLWGPWPAGAHVALVEAAQRDDLRDYLDALLGGEVTVPTSRRLAGAMLMHLRANFPWHPVSTPAGPVIEVFTTPELCAAAYPDRPSQTHPFPMVFQTIPDWYGLSVNPGGPAGLDVPPGQVPQLREMADYDPLAPGSRLTAAERNRWVEVLRGWRREPPRAG